jgi:hypothetical protein
MARKTTAPAANAAPGTSSGKGSTRSTQDARNDLLARSVRNAEGATQFRSDPLSDAKAARVVVEVAHEHAAELSRRGLPASYGEAALELAKEIEEHLQALPAAAVTARGRSPETADLIADAYATAHAVREAVLRVSRGPDGRKTAREFGLGEPLSARQPAHVARALKRILEGLEAHKELRTDIGVLAEDIQIMQDLARDLGTLPGTGAPVSDEQANVAEAQGALRVFFDLVAAKASLALAGDPDERARLLSLIPRAEDRRHLRRLPERASG